MAFSLLSKLLTRVQSRLHSSNPRVLLCCVALRALNRRDRSLLVGFVRSWNLRSMLEAASSV
jgi:hypothetical protein